MAVKYEKKQKNNNTRSITCKSRKQQLISQHQQWQHDLASVDGNKNPTARTAACIYIIFIRTNTQKTHNWMCEANAKKVNDEHVVVLL